MFLHERADKALFHTRFERIQRERHARFREGPHLAAEGFSQAEAGFDVSDEQNLVPHWTIGRQRAYREIAQTFQSPSRSRRGVRRRGGEIGRDGGQSRSGALLFLDDIKGASPDLDALAGKCQ